MNFSGKALHSTASSQGCKPFPQRRNIDMKKILVVLFSVIFVIAALLTYEAYCCYSDSDCMYGRCKGYKCGACYSDSDCKGFGRCKNGRCGGCYSDSDCIYGRCQSGYCGGCYSDADSTYATLSMARSMTMTTKMTPVHGWPML